MSVVLSQQLHRRGSASARQAAFSVGRKSRDRRCRPFRKDPSMFSCVASSRSLNTIPNLGPVNPTCPNQAGVKTLNPKPLNRCKLTRFYSRCPVDCAKQLTSGIVGVEAGGVFHSVSSQNMVRDARRAHCDNGNSALTWVGLLAGTRYFCAKLARSLRTGVQRSLPNLAFSSSIELLDSVDPKPTFLQ